MHRQLPLLLWLSASSVHAVEQGPDPAVACVYDFDGEGLVGTTDLLWLLATFGRQVSDSATVARADANGDGLVNTADLLGLLATFGRPCAADTTPPPVTLEDLVEEFAQAMLEATDPFAPLVAVSSSISRAAVTSESVCAIGVRLSPHRSRVRCGRGGAGRGCPTCAM